jgi:hypothetical protein
MQTGALLHFNIDGDTKDYSAKVIANENDIAENSRSLKVRALIDKIDGNLIAGAFARVQIELGKNEKALMIPTQIPMATIRMMAMSMTMRPIQMIIRLTIPIRLTATTTATVITTPVLAANRKYQVSLKP